MNKLEALKHDITIGLVTLIHKSHDRYVIRYKGLTIFLVFSGDDEISFFDVHDIGGDYASLIANYADSYDISFVSIELPVGFMNFMYVEPKDMRRWMKRTIGSGLTNLYWCVYRNKGDILKDRVFTRTNQRVVVKYYTRNPVDDIYSHWSKIEDLSKEKQEQRRLAMSSSITDTLPC